MTLVYYSPYQTLDMWLLSEEREANSQANRLVHVNKCSKDPVMAKFCGFCGEWALSHALGVPCSRRTEGTVDPYYDLIYKGWKGSVKFTNHKGGRLVEMQTEKHMQWHWASLVVPGPARDCVKIVGAIWRDDFERVCYEKDLGFGVRNVVDQRQLTPIEQFKTELDQA